MNFGKVDNIEDVDFSIPPDHPDTDKILKKSKAKDLQVYVGCAKWNKKDLKNFYPKGTKDELDYYATQFNAIEKLLHNHFSTGCSEFLLVYHQFEFRYSFYM